MKYVYQCFLVFLCMGVLSLPTFSEEGSAPTGMSDTAGTSEIALKDVVVTATKTSIDKKETGVSISVITGDDMDKKGNRTVIEGLKTVPGLAVTQQGLAGGFSSAFLRGAAPRNLLVLIDGVPVNDPTSPDGGFNFADLMADNIDRIEVIRGAQSTLYGSDATAGVVNIITKKGSGANSLSLSVEAGSFSTFREYAWFGGGSKHAHYSFSLSRMDSKGISQAEKAPTATKTPKRDSYENTTATALVSGEIIPAGWLSLTMRYSDALVNIDDAGFDDDPNNIQRSRHFSGAIGFEHQAFSWWRYSFIGNYMSVFRHNNDLSDAHDPDRLNSWYSGARRRVEWRNTFSILSMDEITVGVEYADEMMSSLIDSEFFGFSSVSSFPETNADTLSAYAQNHLKLFKRVFFIAGVRHTKHELFGSNTDWQLSGSAIAPLTETRFKANIATGFKAPSLYQLYAEESFVKGNKDLEPETSKSFDVGFEQPIMDMLTIEASYFKADYRNLIAFQSSTYKNIGKAHTEGFEGGVSIVPHRNVKITGAYTLLGKAYEGDDEKRLVRRPKHQGSATVNARVFDVVNLNATMLYVGKREDDYFDPSTFASERRTLDDYLLFNVAVSVSFLEKYQAFVRCDNITDEQYQDVLGYKRPGRTFFAGLKGTL